MTLSELVRALTATVTGRVPPSVEARDDDGPPSAEARAARPRWWSTYVPRPRAAQAATDTPLGPDPFVALTLQVRLARLGEQVRVLESDPHVWGRARRLIAVEHAYDALLVEACRVAGVTAPRAELRPEDRLVVELALAERGWTW
ncbi:hypothetical protein SAMN05421867_110120 [Cellulomonas marina]|uniref:Uncharacterized protein n=1 Tax=Cellulomonas marina TaxID=988821 RepID=A0A1I0ZG57_9CELL|nr:hypothetical protein SAMN05421867_110120 [Cellulomonas marina]